jgi:hypothetical protein
MAQNLLTTFRVFSLFFFVDVVGLSAKGGCAYGAEPAHDLSRLLTILLRGRCRT